MNRVLVTCLGLLLLTVAVRTYADDDEVARSDEAKRSKEYWGAESVVLGEIVDIKPGKTQEYTAAVIRPTGVLSGRFDPGIVPTFEIQMLRPGLEYSRIGDRNILNLWWDSRREHYLPVGGVGGIQLAGPAGLAMWPIKTFFDDHVDQTLIGIQESRKIEKDLKKVEKKTKKEGYWASHRLVVGSLGATTNQHDGTLPTIDLGPKFTVSGDFDCGLTEHVEVAFEPDFFRQPMKAPTMTASAMLLLVEKGDSWQIASERAEFMPGDHSPCCEIDKASDSKIGDTLKSIWKLREKEYTVPAPIGIPLAGKMMPLVIDRVPHTIRFVSESLAMLDKKEADLYRDGDSFRIVYLDAVFKGTISGDEVTGTWSVKSGKEVEFKGTLEPQPK